MLEKFSCIKDGGLELYSKEYYNSPFTVDQQLLAGFFYAIQSISEELKNPVSFIKLQNSLVYIKSYGDFFLILMFTSVPDETQITKTFEMLAKVVIDYFNLLAKFNCPQTFVDKIDEILSAFESKEFFDLKTLESSVKKIAILGLAKAGKTSIKSKFFNRYSEEQLKSIRPTIGIETSKNLISYLQESIMVMDYGGQNIYRKKYLQDNKNWINISTVIYVIDIQDKNSFLDSFSYLHAIWEKIASVNSTLPLLFIYFHKYDEAMRDKLVSNIQEALIIFKDYINTSTFFLTSIDNNSSIRAIIKTLFLSLPALVIKQILQSFLIEMFQDTILSNIKELNLNLQDSEKLFKAGESIGDEISINFQNKWLEYYLGIYKVPEQQLNTKKVYLTVNGNVLKLEIDNWENQGIASEITNPLLTGFLTRIFKTLYISPSIKPEANKISTIWKIDISSNA